MNVDQVRGRVETVKGWVEELTGRVAHTVSLVQRGLRDRAEGKARAAYGDAKEAVRRRGTAERREPHSAQ